MKRLKRALNARIDFKRQNLTSIDVMILTSKVGPRAERVEK